MVARKIIFPIKKVFSGVPEGLDAYFLVNKFLSEGKSVIHVARDDTRALSLKTAVKFFDPAITVLEFPAWDCLPYDRVSPNKEISCLRMATLTSLVSESAGVKLVITTVNAISQRVPPKEFIASVALFLHVTKSYNREFLISQLVDLGYMNTPSVEEKGDFAVRGGIIDIFPPNMNSPVRLDFFGDQLDQLKVFDAETQLSGDSISKILLCPVSEVVLNEKQIKSFRNSYRHTFGSNGMNDPLYEAISSGRNYLGYEHWGSMFYSKMDTLLNYVSENTPISCDYGVDQILEKRWLTVNQQFDNRSADLNSGSPPKTKNPCKQCLQGFLSREEV